MPSDGVEVPGGAGAVEAADKAEPKEPERQEAGRVNNRPGLMSRARAFLAGRHEIIKDYVQVFALLIAASWAIWVFFYENVYKPMQEVPNVIISTSLEEGGRGKKLIAVKAKATARNVGKREAKILAAWFNVEGFTVGLKDGAAADAYRANVLSQLQRKTKEGAEIDMHASRYADYDEANEQNRRYIFSTNFLLNHSALNPDEEDSKVVTFYVPENEFDLVRVILHVVYSADDSLVRREWAADADGRLRLVRYIRACEGCPEEELNPARPEHRELGRQYGMAHTQSVVDLPLWDKIVSPPNRQTDSDLVLPPEAVVVERK